MMYVGRKRKEYQIHKGLLASHKYWREHLDSKLNEDSQTMYLPQERPYIWDLFVNWLYRGSLKDICMDNKDIAKTHLKQYITLYTQAERWAIPALQNKAIDKLRAINWSFFPRSLIRQVYKDTLGDSPLRAYVVDNFLSLNSLLDAECEDGRPADRLKPQLDYGNHEFVLECYEALIQLTPKSKLRNPHRKRGCNYHKHEDEEECSQ